jgi:hypothetical protein
MRTICDRLSQPALAHFVWCRLLEMSHHLRNLACLCALFFASACESDPGSPSDVDASAAADDQLDGSVANVPCTVELPTECPDPPPRYPDVSPIFKQRCATAGCHSPDWTGPWPLDSYGHIADWADTIRDMLAQCTMPPPEAGTPLPNEESEKILTWIKCKTPK